MEDLETFKTSYSKRIKRPSGLLLKLIVWFLGGMQSRKTLKTLTKHVDGVGQLVDMVELAYPDGKWQRDIIVKSASEYIDRIDSNNEYTQLMHSQLGEFVANFDAIRNDAIIDKRTYSAVVGAIEAAFVIGIVSSKGKITDEMQTEFARRQTAAANEARRNDKIQELIDSCAERIWLKKPSLRANFNQTAREIRAAVMAEITAFGSNVPKGWAPADETTEIERIRKRLAKATKTNKSQI